MTIDGDVQDGAVSPVKHYATALIRGVVEEAKALDGLEHNLVKGMLRELLIARLIRHFLPAGLGVTSGIIVNRGARQSKQTDIVIYDARIPPFLGGEHINLVPVESVLATVEVKSWLCKPDVAEADEAGHVLLDDVLGDTLPPPRVCVFGFFGQGIRRLQKDTSEAVRWLNENVKHLTYVVLAGRFSWIRMAHGWSMQRGTPTHEEVKRFISVLLDNLAALVLMREAYLFADHHDWRSMYLRDQDTGTGQPAINQDMWNSINGSASIDNVPHPRPKS